MSDDAEEPEDEAPPPPEPPTEPITIVLRKPITLGDKVITQIRIRPIKGKDLKLIKPSMGDMATTMLMLRQLSGETNELIDELSGRDLGDAIRAVNDFFLAIR